MATESMFPEPPKEKKITDWQTPQADNADEPIPVYLQPTSDFVKDTGVKAQKSSAEYAPQPPTAASKALQIVQQAAADAKRKQEEELERNMALLDGSSSLNWEGLSPKAQIACQLNRQYLVKRDDGSYSYTRLNFWDAVAGVGIAYEKKLSPLTSDLYPTFKQTNTGNGPAEYRVVNWNTSSEARAKVAASNGLVFGPPKYTPENGYLKRPWPDGSSINKPAWTHEDLGLTCTMTMYVKDANGDVHPEESAFTCWLSEWYAGTGAKGSRAYWDKNPRWMMMVRSKEKNITLASGVGQSEMQEDDAPAVSSPVRGEVVSTEFKEVKQSTK